MVRLPKWLLGILAVALLVGLTSQAKAADTQGRIKSVNADKASFVMTDENGKDWTFKAGDGIQVRRNDKAASLRELQENDEVRITYAKDGKNLVASDIKVTTAAPVANASLSTRGKIKTVDTDKSEFVLTDKNGKDWKFHVADKAKVHASNNKDATFRDLKAGDAVLVTYKKNGNEFWASDVREEKGDKDATRNRKDR